MMPTDFQFDTDAFFSGGAGMFIQYDDIIKPIGMYVVLKMIVSEDGYGLPINILKELTNFSLVEWYVNRRYINPLRNLDFLHKLDPKELDLLYEQILDSDPSIYRISPSLNVVKMFSIYRKQQMRFPVYIYHPTNSDAIKNDCNSMMSGVNIKYVHGEIEDALNFGGQNFTYIFSDIEMLKRASEVLHGTCSHVLLAGDYRYNKIGCTQKFKYDLLHIAKHHPFIRMGTTNAINKLEMAVAISNLYR